MKSIIKTTIYASLGLLSDGTDAMQKLGRELARRADISEAEGEKVARQWVAKSSHAVKLIRKNLDAEVTKIAHTMQAAIKKDTSSKKSKHPAAGKSSASKSSARKSAKVKHKPVRAPVKGR